MMPQVFSLDLGLVVLTLKKLFFSNSIASLALILGYPFLISVLISHGKVSGIEPFLFISVNKSRSLFSAIETDLTEAFKPVGTLFLALVPSPLGKVPRI